MPPSSCGWKQGPEATPQGHRGHPQRTTQAPVLDSAACAEMRPSSAYICGLVKAAQTDWTMTFHSSQHCNGLREARAPRTAPSPYCPPPLVLCNAPTASCVSTTPQPLPLQEPALEGSSGEQRTRAALCAPQMHYWPLGIPGTQLPNSRITG